MLTDVREDFLALLFEIIFQQCDQYRAVILRSTHTLSCQSQDVVNQGTTAPMPLCSHSIMQAAKSSYCRKYISIAVQNSQKCLHVLSCSIYSFLVFFSKHQSKTVIICRIQHLLITTCFQNKQSVRL